MELLYCDILHFIERCLYSFQQKAFILENKLKRTLCAAFVIFSSHALELGFLITALHVCVLGTCAARLGLHSDIKIVQPFPLLHRQASRNKRLIGGAQISAPQKVDSSHWQPDWTWRAPTDEHTGTHTGTHTGGHHPQVHMNKKKQPFFFGVFFLL